MLQHFLTLHPKSIDLSLERLARLLNKLGNPQHHLPPVIHIAGTNGKGSVLATLRALLEAQGKKVHAYTSPHLVRFNERIRLAGTLVQDDALIEAFEKCERLNDDAPITFFEITTAAAFDLFSQIPADYVLLETGLGGTFDTTNVVAQPALTIITPVSMDHMEFLGDTIGKIAGEKAGILKQNVPLILARQQDEARDVILARAAQLSVPVIEAGVDFDGFEEAGRLVHQTNDGLLDLPLPQLAGDFQIDNTSLAVQAMLHLHPDSDLKTLERGIKNTIWPARLQRLHGALTRHLSAHETLWLDGGHNVAGAEQIARFFDGLSHPQGAPLTLIMGMLNNKDCAGYLRAIAAHHPKAHIFALKVPETPNSFEAEEIVRHAQTVGLTAERTDSLEAAIKQAQARTDKPQHILITGTLYLAGHALAQNKTPPT